MQQLASQNPLGVFVSPLNGDLLFVSGKSMEYYPKDDEHCISYKYCANYPDYIITQKKLPEHLYPWGPVIMEFTDDGCWQEIGAAYVRWKRWHTTCFTFRKTITLPKMYAPIDRDQFEKNQSTYRKWMKRWSIWFGNNFSATGSGYGSQIKQGHIEGGGIIIADITHNNLGSLRSDGLEYKFFRWFFEQLVKQKVITEKTLQKLSELQAKSTDIDWNLLFADDSIKEMSTIRDIPLPTSEMSNLEQYHSTIHFVGQWIAHQESATNFILEGAIYSATVIVKRLSFQIEDLQQMRVIRQWLSAIDSILAALVSRSNDVISLIPLSQPSVSLVSPTMALRTQISNILAISEEEIMPLRQL